MRKLLLLLLSLVISAMLALVHVRVIDMPHWEGQVLLHRQILEHQAPAPYQFRTLQPILPALVWSLFPEARRDWLRTTAERAHRLRGASSWLLT